MSAGNELLYACVYACVRVYLQVNGVPVNTEADFLQAIDLKVLNSSELIISPIYIAFAHSIQQAVGDIVELGIRRALPARDTGSGEVSETQQAGSPKFADVVLKLKL